MASAIIAAIALAPAAFRAAPSGTLPRIAANMATADRSAAETFPASFFSILRLIGPSTEDRSWTSLRLRTMSATSSTTPSMEVNS